jgi:hypothetical protein
VIRRSLRHLLWLLPLAVLALYLLNRYVWLTPEEEVRRFVAGGESAIESMSVLRCEPYLDKDFMTGSGMSRQTFLYYARTEFVHLEDLRVDVDFEELTIAEDEEHAEVLLDVGLSGRDKEGSDWRALAEGGRRFLVTLRLRKRDGDWKCYFAEW